MVLASKWTRLISEWRRKGIIGSDILVDCKTAIPEKQFYRPQPLVRGRVNAGVQDMTGKLPTRYKALRPALLFSLSWLVRFGLVRQSVGLNETHHRLGHTSRLWNRETWEQRLQVSTPRKRSSERRSIRHDWEIAHQRQSSETGLTIFSCLKLVRFEPVAKSVS